MCVCTAYGIRSWNCWRINVTNLFLFLLFLIRCIFYFFLFKGTQTWFPRQSICYCCCGCCWFCCDFIIAHRICTAGRHKTELYASIVHGNCSKSVSHLCLLSNSVLFVHFLLLFFFFFFFYVCFVPFFKYMHIYMLHFRFSSFAINCVFFFNFRVLRVCVCVCCSSSSSKQ